LVGVISSSGSPLGKANSIAAPILIANLAIINKLRRSKNGNYRYGFGFFAGDCEGTTEAAGSDVTAGVALPAGTTPAPESGAGEETGEG
jgi:hypothetical protein